ncbi:MAG TPA: hypothetical protein VGX94_05230 [Terriglobia bacterium]|nr:hypothetical protein [Terriglobia bacterium]
MKLNGWKRIGIIASVAWILGAGMYTYESGLDSAVGLGTVMSQSCDQGRDRVERSGSDWEREWRECRKNGDEAVSLGVTNAEISAALVAFVPVPLGWGFAYLVLFLMRWVRCGFVRPSDGGTLA